MERHVLSSQEFPTLFDTREKQPKTTTKSQVKTQKTCNIVFNFDKFRLETFSNSNFSVEASIFVTESVAFEKVVIFYHAGSTYKNM